MMEEDGVQQFSQVKWTMNKVAEVAGPSVLTKAVLESMDSDTGKTELLDRWKKFARTKQPVRIGSTLVLPVDAVCSFSFGQDCCLLFGDSLDQAKPILGLHKEAMMCW